MYRPILCTNLVQTLFITDGVINKTKKEFEFETHLYVSNERNILCNRPHFRQKKKKNV